MFEYLTTSSQSEMMVPNVIDITGPISGETSMAATILDAEEGKKLSELQLSLFLCAKCEFH